MKNTTSIFSLEEFKIQASILLKALQSKQANEAIQRFKVLSEFRSASEEVILSSAKRKHALTVIALENQFESWAKLKAYCDKTMRETFVEAYIGGHLNKWFANYDEAKAEQNRAGGYLLPYKTQYFICDEDYIARLGLDPKDKHWQAIDYDWVQPKSQKAWQLLNQQWCLIQKNQQGER